MPGARLILPTTPTLFPQWLAVPNHSNDPACPVCKAVIEMPNLDPSKAKVIPLYVNGKSEADPRT
jgi:hypothetical protein